MAVKDIKELKKDLKNPIDRAKSGCCIFCGQSCLVETDEEDPEKLNELATLECKCKEAIDYKRRKEKSKPARENPNARTYSSVSTKTLLKIFTIKVCKVTNK